MSRLAKNTGWNVLCVLVHCRDVAPRPPPPVSVASCEKQQVSDVVKLVDKTVGLQFDLLCHEVYPQPSKKSVSELFDHTLYFTLTFASHAFSVFYSEKNPKKGYCKELLFPHKFTKSLLDRSEWTATCLTGIITSKIILENAFYRRLYKPQPLSDE
jgi:hypothetical protein